MEKTTISLPHSWKSVKLGQFVESEKGKKPKRQRADKTEAFTLPYVDIEAFEESNIKSWTDGDGCRLCYESDFLMVWDGSRSGLVGKGIRGALGSTLVRINFPSMDNQYAYYFLLSKYQEINTRAKGSGTPHVDPDLLWNYDFPIAPLNEQKRIVAKIEELFSELDNGIAALKTAREQLKVYRQAVLKHAFEGKLTAKWREENAGKLETPEQLLARIQQERDACYQQQLEEWKAAVKAWEADGKEGKKPGKPRQHQYDIKFSSDEVAKFPKLPANWMWIPLNELISGLPRSMQSGPFGSNLKHSEFTASGKLVLGIDNVKDGYFSIGSENRISEQKFAELAKYEVRPGDLLITVMASLGRTCVVPRDIEQAIITKHVYRISMEQQLLYPEFYNYLLQGHTISRLRMFENAQGQTRPGLNSTILQELPVPLCDIAEQEKIVERIEENLSNFSQLEHEIESALKRSETLRQSILKKAFSGQLVAQDANDEPASELLARIQQEKVQSRQQNKSVRKQTNKNSTANPANVVPFPKRTPGISSTDLHAGILAMAYKMHPQNAKHFHHVKAEKIAHLVESHLGIDLGRNPVKDAAGPNDYPHLKKVESRASKASWFATVQDKQSGIYNFHPKPGFEKLLDKTRNALGEHINELESLLELLAPLNTQQAEIVATLYAAWNNLLLEDKPASDEQIVTEARENWHPDKLNIERERFFKALDWIRNKGLIPVGRGRLVKGKTKKVKK